MTDEEKNLQVLRKEIDYYKRQVDKVAVENIKLDYTISELRHVVQQKQQGFALLSELQQSLGTHKEISSIFAITLRAINSTLGMGKTVILTPADQENCYQPSHWLGFSVETSASLSSLSFEFPAVFVTGAEALLVNKSSEKTSLIEQIQKVFDLPYFICVPIIIDTAPIGLLLTGRVVEVLPMHPPLDQGDIDTLRAIAGLISVVVKNMRLDNLKDEFLANTSHELRTPINGIIGIADSLIDGTTGDLPKGTKDNLAMIVQSGKRLSNLIDDILDFSKMKNQELELQLKPVDIRSIAHIVLTLTSSQISHKPIVLKNDFPDSLPLVTADENRLQQILLNLVGNAVKFTHEGEVRVSAQQEGDSIQIFVSDTGVGISPDQQERIFLSFEQADGSTAREYGGTGLGLAVTKNLVELHGSDIIVESSEGQGSTFSFYLSVASDQTRIESPELKADRLKSGGEEEIEKKEEKPQSEKKEENTILVVDDEAINVQVLTNHLQLYGYRILTAHDGFQALELLQTEIPDLIILDLMMPRMNGYEVAQKIRKSHDAAALPIVMLTAKNQVNDLTEGLQSGANDYLIKPFSKQELLSRIKTHLHLSNINAATRRFVPHQFLHFLEKETLLDIRLGEHVSKSMSILFVDIRSFTTLSEGMTPEENFKFINSYLSHMGPLVRKNQGFIDKFIGDAIMALFDRNADDALLCAIGMVQQLDKYNKGRKRADYPPIQIGIGIHTGNLMLGTIGEEDRMEGTVISDAVNLAARIEGMTKFYRTPLLISYEAFQHLKDPEQFDIRTVDKVAVKGKTAPVIVLEVFNHDPQPIRDAKKAMIPLLEQAFSIYYSKQFQEALVLFTHCLAKYPEDPVTKIYIERCSHYLKVGADENWDGVERLTIK